METNNTTTIEANVACFNPYFLTGDKKNQIDRLYFFDSTKGEIVFSESWFNESGSNNQTPKVTFPFLITKKRVKDLTKNVAFYTPMESNYSFDKGKISVYIPIQLLPNFTEKKNVFEFETETEKQYKDRYTFDLLCVKKLYRLNDLAQLESYESEEKIQTIQASGTYKAVLKPFGEEVKEVTETLKAAGLKDVSRYDIEKILSVYTMTKK